MKIMMICKYPPIQGGVSAEAYWTANAFAELGHSVSVLTNTDEVESSYRIQLNDDDKILLKGFRNKGYIRLCSSSIDKKHGLFPDVPIVESPHAPEVMVNGKKVLMFATNNYLGLIHDERVVEVARE